MLKKRQFQALMTVALVLIVPSIHEASSVQRVVCRAAPTVVPALLAGLANAKTINNLPQQEFFDFLCQCTTSKSYRSEFKAIQERNDSTEIASMQFNYACLGGVRSALPIAFAIEFVRYAYNKYTVAQKHRNPEKGEKNLLVTSEPQG